MSIDGTAVAGPPDEEFILHPWICRTCQWALFTSLGRKDGILSTAFLCGYPDEELQRRACETACMSQCAQYRPRPEWSLARDADVIVHRLPEEGA